MNILFMGTPDFAVPCLEHLIKSPHNVVGVFTQPDKPQGRKMVLTPPPVKVCAAAHEIPVYQPLKMRDGEAMALITQCNPDLIVVVAFGKILPKDILDYPKYGCVNIHGSLLPKYRGAAPIQWSVILGEEETGVTSMFMAKGLDTGDMLLKTVVKIEKDETAGELFDRLKEIGAENLMETIRQLEAGTITPIPQKEEDSTYASMLNKEMATIDFSKPAKGVHDLIRGLNPWPIAHTFVEGKKMKVYTSKMGSKQTEHAWGQVLGLKKGSGLEVACGNGTIFLQEIQFEGKKRMDIEEFLRGHAIENGVTLG